MKRKLPLFTKLASVALFLAPCAAAHAATVTFASFNDTTVNKWVYSNGTLTASSDNAFFVSFLSPTPILNYIGPVTYNVTAAASGPATLSGGMISQQIDGQMTFTNGSTTILDVVFSGALITGVPNSNSSGVTADTQIAGNVISYSTDPSVQLAPFTGPFSFSIALTQTPGLALNGNNLADFIATASGTFTTNAEPGGANPTPLPPAALGGLGLLAGLTGARRLRRKA
jgi:hypothetical protein